MEVKDYGLMETVTNIRTNLNAILRYDNTIEVIKKINVVVSAIIARTPFNVNKMTKYPHMQGDTIKSRFH